MFNDDVDVVDILLLNMGWTSGRRKKGNWKESDFLCCFALRLILLLHLVIFFSSYYYYDDHYIFSNKTSERTWAQKSSRNWCSRWAYSCMVLCTLVSLWKIAVGALQSVSDFYDCLPEWVRRGKHAYTHTHAIKSLWSSASAVSKMKWSQNDNHGKDAWALRKVVL